MQNANAAISQLAASFSRAYTHTVEAARASAAKCLSHVYSEEYVEDLIPRIRLVRIDNNRAVLLEDDTVNHSSLLLIDRY